MHLLYARWFAKAMRDLGMFNETARVMREHGRDPQGLFDEPMLKLRNQGQILGEEREGHFVRATGSWDGENKLFAHRVTVVTREEACQGEDPVALSALTSGGTPTAEAVLDTSTVCGEIVKRTENLLTVRTGAGSLKTIEVLPDALVEIPEIPGDNNVNQLKHHLEIQRMSKSKGNVVSPDEWVARHGSDTVRAYLMFGFDWMKGGPWDSQGIQGVVRWLHDVWDLVIAGPTSEQGDPAAERAIERRVHQTIHKVGDGLESFSFNTSIAALMALKNDLKAAARDQKIGAEAWNEAVQAMLLLMAPFTPHIAEELWGRLGLPYSIHSHDWPQYDADKAAEDETTLVVMRNGKPIDRLTVPADISEDSAKELALNSPAAQRVLNGGAPKRVIFIPGRTGGQPVEPKVNIVT